MRAKDHPLFGPNSGCGRLSFPTDLLRQILALSSPGEQEQQSEEEEGKDSTRHRGARAKKEEETTENSDSDYESVSESEYDETDSPKQKAQMTSPQKSQTAKTTSKRKRKSPVVVRHTKVLSKRKPRLTEGQKSPKKKKKAFDKPTATSETKKIQQVIRKYTACCNCSLRCSKRCHKWREYQREHAHKCSSNRKIHASNRTTQGHYGLHLCGEFTQKRMLCSAHFEKVRGDTLNNKPVWQSLENSNLWLWMTKSGSWMVGTTKNKRSGLERGFLVSDGPPGRNPTYVKRWKVWSNSKGWRVDTTARVTGYKYREWIQRIKDMNASVQTKARSQAVALRVSGAQEELSMLINGYFILQSDLYNLRPLYRKYPAEDIWVRFGPDGDWIISTGTDKDENSSGG